jgi:hypothetical protein
MKYAFLKFEPHKEQTASSGEGKNLRDVEAQALKSGAQKVKSG